MEVYRKVAYVRDRVLFHGSMKEVLDLLEELCTEVSKLEGKVYEDSAPK